MQNQIALAYTAPAVELEDRQELTSPIVWWVVLLVVLLALAVVLSVAAAIWCVSHGGGVVISVSEHWPFVTIGCSK